MKNNFNPGIFYPAKLSFKVGGTIKIFRDKQKLPPSHHYKISSKEFCTQK
jgi:hypothetical protein